MPSKDASRELSVTMAKSVIVDAPIDVVWEILRDIPSYPTIFTTCLNIQPATSKIDGDLASTKGIYGKGSRYIYTRMVSGRKADFEYTITKADIDPVTGERQLATAKQTGFATGTKTFTLQEIDDSSCLLMISFAIIPRTMWGHIRLRLTIRQLRLITGDTLTADLQDVVTEAAKRTSKMPTERPDTHRIMASV